MRNSINQDIKEKFVSSINNGLYETQSRYSGYEIINNAKHFVKMDDIANSVINSLKSNVSFEIFIIKRGSYKLPLFYDKNNDVLYSLMSSRRFQELLDRKDFSQVHYLDALITLNDKLLIDKKQLALFDSSSESNLHIINNIKEDIIQTIGLEPGKYMTIAFDMDGFKLLGVEAILTSEYLEVAYREDWSELIEIDYNDLSYLELEDENDSDDLEITIKPNVSRNDDITEEEITPKVMKKSNRSQT
ncbi:DUF5986 family protein [Halanaerobium salsuginis]|jgi:hypothetical protein|uniref:Uncharacterized protein n=1 Tax=Halanaerobium salsuginis TaxID=29563 RepID=A0A1I4MPM3_9FIRM|nr:DUF5986 family protein [Halanaerobium salsuginis]SFM05214.1 hypothetical protein SAMN02983006_02674 [Halanaerobium salsuginis]